MTNFGWSQHISQGKIPPQTAEPKSARAMGDGFWAMGQVMGDGMDDKADDGKWI